jgi:hypothetical protein
MRPGVEVVALSTWLVVAGSGLGCGRSELDRQPAFDTIDASVRPEAGDASPDEGAAASDGPATAALCPSAGWPDPARIAVVALAGGQLVLTRADGTELALPIPNPGSSWNPQGFWRQGDLLLAAGVTPSAAAPRLEAVVVDSLGAERWRVSRPLGIGALLGEEVYLDASGAAALRIDGSASESGVAVMPGGDAYSLSEIPQSAPDLDGWILVSRADADRPLGFVNAVTGEARASRLPLARPNYPGFYRDGRLTYLGYDSGETVLVVESPGGSPDPNNAARDPLPATFDASKGTVIAIDGGVVVAENARPRWLLYGEPPVFTEVRDLPGDGGEEGFFATAAGELRGLMQVANAPRWSVDLQTGAVTPIAPVGPLGTGSPVDVRIVEGWAVGLFDGGSWWADLVTGESGRLDFSALAPLVGLGSPGCAGRTGVIEGRRLVTGMRDRRTAGLYVGRLDQAPWERIGRPVSQVKYVSGYRVADTRVVSARSGANDFCPPQVWDPPQAGEDPLTGDSVQILLPGAAEPVVFQGHQLQEIAFHASGRCAILDGVVYDLAAGSTRALPPSASVAWWDEGELR